MAREGFCLGSLKQWMNFLVAVSRKYFEWRVEVCWQPLRLQFTRAKCCLDHGRSVLNLIV